MEKLTFLGSSCIYPKNAEQPMREDALLTGPLEPTNEWYAIAKIAGLKMCEAYRMQHGCDFISAMPTNLYGPNDNFDLNSSHVLPALIAKAHDAKMAGARSLNGVGIGRAAPRVPSRGRLRRCAVVFLTTRYSGAQHVNVGSGEEISIADLARLVLRVVGHEAELQFDTSKPDGTPRKLMDNTKLRTMGWSPRIPLEQGVRDAYAGISGRPGASALKSQIALRRRNSNAPSHAPAHAAAIEIDKPRHDAYAERARPGADGQRALRNRVACHRRKDRDHGGLQAPAAPTR